MKKKATPDLSTMKGVFDAVSDRLEGFIHSLPEKPASKLPDFKSRLDLYQRMLSIRTTLSADPDQLESLDLSLTKSLDQKRQENIDLKVTLGRQAGSLVKTEAGEIASLNVADILVLSQKVTKKETERTRIQEAIAKIEQENEELAATPLPEEVVPPTAIRNYRSKVGEIEKGFEETESARIGTQRDYSIKMKKLTEQINKERSDVEILEMQLSSLESRIELMVKGSSVPRKPLSERKRDFEGMEKQQEDLEREEKEERSGKFVKKNGMAPRKSPSEPKGNGGESSPRMKAKRTVESVTDDEPKIKVAPPAHDVQVRSNRPRQGSVEVTTEQENTNLKQKKAINEKEENETSEKQKQTKVNQPTKVIRVEETTTNKKQKSVEDGTPTKRNLDEVTKKTKKVEEELVKKDTKSETVAIAKKTKKADPEIPTTKNKGNKGAQTESTAEPKNEVPVDKKPKKADEPTPGKKQNPASKKDEKQPTTIPKKPSIKEETNETEKPSPTKNPKIVTHLPVDNERTGPRRKPIKNTQVQKKEEDLSIEPDNTDTDTNIPMRQRELDVEDEPELDEDIYGDKPTDMSFIEVEETDDTRADCDCECRVTNRIALPNGFELTFYHIAQRIPKTV